MDKKFVLFSILASFLIGSSFGIFTIEDSFAADNLDVSREDSEAYQKQLEKAEEAKKEAEERKLKAEEKAEERKLKAEEKAEERKLKAEEKAEERKLKAEEKRKKLEERKVKLDSDRKKLEEKLLEKANKYEEKLKELKEKYQNRIESGFLDDIEKFSAATAKLEDKYVKKSEEIRKKLLEKQEKLDSRTQKILDKINEGNYLGDKIGISNIIETYDLVFDSVDATSISDKTKTSSFSGIMSFKTFDKGKSNLKLELEECQINVDDVPYNCGFGKARTISSGDSGSKDSLVIIAFLEDDYLEEVHSTLKISLNADSPIGEIDGSSQVSILGPQSKISGMWFLDGTGTLTRTVSTTDDSTENEYDVSVTEEVGVSGD